MSPWSQEKRQKRGDGQRKREGGDGKREIERRRKRPTPQGERKRGSELERELESYREGPEQKRHSRGLQGKTKPLPGPHSALGLREVKEGQGRSLLFTIVMDTKIQL